MAVVEWAGRPGRRGPPRRRRPRWPREDERTATAASSPPVPRPTRGSCARPGPRPRPRRDPDGNGIARTHPGARRAAARLPRRSGPGRDRRDIPRDEAAAHSPWSLLRLRGRETGVDLAQALADGAPGLAGRESDLLLVHPVEEAIDEDLLREPVEAMEDLLQGRSRLEPFVRVGGGPCPPARCLLRLLAARPAAAVAQAV